MQKKLHRIFLIELGSQGVAIDDSADYFRVMLAKYGEVFPEIKQVENC